MADFAALQDYLTGLRKDEAPVPTAGSLDSAERARVTTAAATPAQRWPASTRFLDEVAGHLRRTERSAVGETLMCKDTPSDSSSRRHPRPRHNPDVPQSSRRDATGGAARRVDQSVAHRSRAVRAPQLQRLTPAVRSSRQVTIPGSMPGSAAAGAPALPGVRTTSRGAPGRARAISERPAGRLRSCSPRHALSVSAVRRRIIARRRQVRGPAAAAGRHAGPRVHLRSRAYRPGTTIPTDACQLTAVGDARDLQLTQIECSAGAAADDAGAGHPDVVRVNRRRARIRGRLGRVRHDRLVEPVRTDPRRLQRRRLEQGRGRPVCRSGSGRSSLRGRGAADSDRPRRISPRRRRSRTGRSRAAFRRAWSRSMTAPSAAPTRTSRSISTFDQRYASCTVRPSYIILFGDSNDVPTFTMQRLLKAPGEMIATDYPYATLGSDPEYDRPDSRLRGRPPLGQLTRGSPGRRRQDRRL